MDTRARMISVDRLRQSILLTSLLLLLGLHGVQDAEGLVSTASRTCLGTSNKLAQSGNDASIRLREYRKRYTNCTYVSGNLELTYLNTLEDYDLGFLSTIEEVTGYVLISVVYMNVIPLTNLRLIRGQTTYAYNGKEYSLFVGTNYKASDRSAGSVGLKELRLSSLSEILDGNVYFHDNYFLCYVDKITWDDILPTGFNAEIIYTNPSLKSTTCGRCNPECKTKPCWGSGPSACQKLTKVNCSEQCDARCNSSGPRGCCHKECAAGCTGPKKSECLACRNMNRMGQCEQFCPPQFIYSPKDFKQIPNPDFLYSNGFLCVKNCPPHLASDGQNCVQECSAGKTESGGAIRTCVDCNGPCPKQCDITDIISSTNIDSLVGCTRIKGSVRILQSTFTADPHLNTSAVRVGQLYALESVVEVSDFVQIESNDESLKNLTFLRKLQTIRGQSLTNDGKSLHIYDTRLQTLDLESLRQILHGNVFIKKNPRLCFVAGLNWNRLFNDPQRQAANIVNNSNTADCEVRHDVCSAECSPEGCWGPRDDQCLGCRNFHLGARCLASCAIEPLMYENGTDECLPCHEECATSCNDSTPSSCDACLHVRDGPYCILSCPEPKYPDPAHVCQPCDAHCEGGCTGPGSFVGPGACNSCAIALFVSDGETRCLLPDAQCPDGYYRSRVGEEGPLKGKHSCSRCYAECATCDQLGPSYCTTCLHYKEIDACDPGAPPGCVPSFRCVGTCSPGRYLLEGTGNETGLCIPCDRHCRGGCRGPAPTDCVRCHQYTLYADFDKREVDGRFNCTEKCPDWASYILPLKTEDDESLTACVTTDPNLRNKVLIIVGSVIGGMICIGVIILGIVVYLSRRAKAQADKKYVDCVSNGMALTDLHQPLNASNANPDLAELRLINEKELKSTQLIGEGAFGTVHKGFWYPENEKIKIPVAIKHLKGGSGGGGGSNLHQDEELRAEVRIMASVRHEYCLPILAFCMGQEMCIVTPMMVRGSMLDYIRTNKSAIGSKTLLNWCVQIAEGMKYLEEKRIVHRDLAARNVLVHSSDHVKITDFGLSKLLDHDEDSVRITSGKVPIRWLALESIQDQTYTHKSDVWSYGVTLWEMFTYGNQPHKDVHPHDMLELLQKGGRLKQPDICTIDVFMLMVQCWWPNPETRPSFHKLSSELKKMASDPGRYLVIPGDALMRLPSHRDDSALLLRSLSVPVNDADEPIVSADDYLQPRSFSAQLAPPDERGEEGLEAETALDSPESPWNRAPRLENSGNSGSSSDKLSVWEAQRGASSDRRTRASTSSRTNPAGHTRANNPLNSQSATAQPRRPVERRENPRRENPGSSRGNPGSPGIPDVPIEPPPLGGKHKSFRYTSDPCKNSFERQPSSDIGSLGSTGSSHAERSGRHPEASRRDGHPSRDEVRTVEGSDDVDGCANGMDVVERRMNDRRSAEEEEGYLEPLNGNIAPSSYLQVVGSLDRRPPHRSEGPATSPDIDAFENPEYFDDFPEGANLLGSHPINIQQPPSNHGNRTKATLPPPSVQRNNNKLRQGDYYNDMPSGEVAVKGRLLRK